MPHSVRIDPIPLAGPALSAAYVDDYASVDRFYNAGPPVDPASYRGVAEALWADGSSARWDRLRGLKPVDPATAERLQKLAEGKGLLVATGQQAGLFVSPLLTLYKALTAARLAAQLEAALGVPVMPLFSIASEDHDWAEVNHTHLLDTENRLVRLAVDGPGSTEPGGPAPPVDRIQLGSDVEAALDEMVEFTPETEFRAGYLDLLRNAYAPGLGFAQAFESTLGWLLQDHRFLLVRTAHRYVKEGSRELLWAEWEARHQSEARLLDRVAQLESAGFEPQVPVTAGTTNLFLDGDLGRDRILQDGEDARLRRSGESMTGDQLREILDAAPGRVSPGALLRPVTEATAFPVVAYVGGPAEIAYLAESQVLFDLHGVPAPVVVPRAAFQIVESKVERVLDKYGLQPTDLADDSGATLKRLIAERTPAEIQDSLSALRRSLTEGLDRLEKAAVEYDAGAKSALGSGRQAVFGSLKALESKLQARVREKNQVMQQQLEKAAANLYPGGRPQERVLNPFQYLIRYGDGLLEAIYQRVVTPLG